MPQLLEIRPNLWVYETSTANMTVRGALVIGDRHAAVWDTLAHPADVNELSALLGEKPFHVIYSHADWDHCWGTCGLSAEPLAVIAHAECRRRFDTDVPETLQEMRLADLGKWDRVRLVPPNLTFSTRLSLDLGGITLDLHHLPGHTADCIVGWLPEWGLLLAGDTVETPLPVVNSAPEIATWLEALEGWARLSDLKQCIPSHGSMEGRAALDSTVGYLRALLSIERDCDLPAELDDFYRTTHEKNVSLVIDESDEDE